MDDRNEAEQPFTEERLIQAVRHWESNFGVKETRRVLRRILNSDREIKRRQDQIKKLTGEIHMLAGP